MTLAANKYQKYSLPLYGPLLISNVEQFLIDSKKQFFERYENKNTIRTLPVKRFEILCTVGKGNFGTVKLVKYKKKNKETYFAMKTINKCQLVEINRVSHALTEKRILQSLDYPFTIRMEFFCKDSSYIYFVMPFVSGGDMFSHLRHMKKFKEELSRFYASQVVLALEYLQYLHFVYRDLKPENILIDHFGFLKLTDFGFAKLVEDRTYTFCGTPPYIAPEIIQGRGYARSADWWSLGILIYEMSTGYPPFRAHGTTNLYIRIMYDSFELPNFFSSGQKTILRKLLQKDVSRRLGNMKYGADEVKREKWFKEVNWIQLLNRQTEPPFIPKSAHPGDTSNFAGVTKSSTMLINKIDDIVPDLFKDF